MRRSLEPVKAPNRNPISWGPLASRPYGRFETLTEPSSLCVWISSSKRGPKVAQARQATLTGLSRGQHGKHEHFHQKNQPNTKRKSMCGIGQKNPGTDKRRFTHKKRGKHENLGSAGNTNSNRPRKPILAGNDRDRKQNNEIGPKGPFHARERLALLRHAGPA